MPLTPNKKIDKRALPAPDESAVIKNEYIEPKTEIEKAIAKVWMEVLGYKKISLTDNFFELGGDSIKGIQVISKLKESGVKLEVKYLLQNPTILQLSKYIETNDLAISQEMVEGEVILTPVQRYFMEHNKNCSMNHFGQSVTLFSEDGFDEELTAKAFEELAIHHDALRMTFDIKEDEVVQNNRGIEGEIYELKVIDIRSLGEEKEEFIKAEAKKLQDMNLKKGPLFKGMIIKDTDGDHLYMVIHHFVVDGVSWRFIVEDFVRVYKTLKEGKEVHISAKTSSYKDWAEAIENYANNGEALNEVDYWNSVVIDDEVKLQVKDSSNKKSMNSNKLLTASLEEKETEVLLKEVNKAFNTEINDILLTALSSSIKEVFGQNKIAINLEGHGREEILKGIDINRTVGWFTSIFPVVLECDHENMAQNIIRNKEIREAIPNKGVGYGMLKYLNKDKVIKNEETPNVCFNYLGQVAENNLEKNNITMSSLNINCDIGDEITSIYDMDLSCIIKNNKLVVNISFNNEKIDEETAEKIIDSYIKELSKIIKFCVQFSAENQLEINAIKEIYNQPFVMLLNEKKDKNLFVFPPHMPKVAYNILYKNLSMYIDDYSFYMFNFLETDKIVDCYVEKVKEIQKDGPYVLMGYSFGGALAFEVADRLVKEGKTVSDVILIDSYVVEDDSFSNINLDFVRAEIRESLRVKYKDVITNEDFLEEIVSSFINYYIYTKDFVNSKDKLDLNIHLIRGVGQVPNIKDTRHIWPSLTSKEYYEYQGVGTHNLMLNGEYLNTNAEILVNLLKNI